MDVPRMLQAWKDMHGLVQHDDAPPPTKPNDKNGLSKISLCMRVGRCICQDSRRGMRAALVSCLKRLFKKGSKPRRYYESDQAVIRVFSVGGPRARHVSSFWYIGFGNLSEGNFVVEELRPVRESDDPALACLESDSGEVMMAHGQPMDLFAAVESMPVDRVVSCQLHYLVLNCDEAMGTFQPVALVGRVESEEKSVFWNPCGRRAPLALPAPEQEDSDAPPDEVVEDHTM